MIFVLENEPSNLEVICMSLEMEGFETKPFDTGDNFIGNVQSNRPNLIIMDIELGGHDGRDLCKMLKETDVINSIPIIIVSAVGETKLRSSFNYGADRIIYKPFDIYSLVKEAKQLLGLTN